MRGKQHADLHIMLSPQLKRTRHILLIVSRIKLSFPAWESARRSDFSLNKISADFLEERDIVDRIGEMTVTDEETCVIPHGKRLRLLELFLPMNRKTGKFIQLQFSPGTMVANRTCRTACTQIGLRQSQSAFKQGADQGGETFRIPTSGLKRLKHLPLFLQLLLRGTTPFSRKYSATQYFSLHHSLQPQWTVSELYGNVHSKLSPTDSPGRNRRHGRHRQFPNKPAGIGEAKHNRQRPDSGTTQQIEFTANPSLPDRFQSQYGRGNVEKIFH